MQINEIYKPFLEATETYLVFKGGAGSGKSVFISQKIILDCLKNKRRFLIVRKVASTLLNSVYRLFLDIIEQNELWEYVEVNKTEKRFVFKDNGSEIMCVGLDDPEKIKSVAGITHIWIEEASELSYTDFNQLDLRLRGNDGIKRQMFLSFNPIDDQHWLKTQFFDQDAENVRKITTTYLDNSFIDEDYHIKMQSFKLRDENYYRIYALGEWGKLRTGGEFYKHFSKIRHTEETLSRYNPEVHLHLSFDFNVLPYVSCTAWQIEGKQIYQIAEFCAKPPNNSTKALVRMAVSAFPYQKGIVKVYGDFSGKNKKTNGINDFGIVLNDLAQKFKTQDLVKPNASVQMRASFINEIFFANYGEWEIIIGEHCINTIQDLENVQESEDGTKRKVRIKDQKTGQSYEPFGHLSDSLDYFICGVLEQDFRKFSTKPAIIPRSVSRKTKRVY